MGIVEARAALTRLPARLRARRGAPQTVAVTRKGEPVLAIMPWNLYEGLVETIELLSDEEAAASLRRSLRDAEEGRLLTTRELRRELGLP